MAFSVGGFARSLQGSMAKDSDMRRDLEKQRLLQELKKEYESQIVRADLTTVEGDGAGGFREVRRNQFGDTINERILTPEEAEQRKAELERIKSESRRAGAMAESAEFQVENQEELLALDMEGKRANIEQSRASAAASRESAENSRFSRRRAAGEDDRKLKDEIAELQGTLASIENDGSVSDSALAETLAVKLERAANTIEDPDELRREVLRLKAQAKRIESRARTSDSTRRSSAGSGSALMDLIQRGRGLDQEEDFSVVPGGR